MNISHGTIEAVVKLVTGDRLQHRDYAIAPYMSGLEIIRFFNQHGADDSYPRNGGAPSRWKMAEDYVKSHVGQSSMKEVLTALLDPRRFFDTEFEPSSAINYLNKYLQFDGYECTLRNNRVQVRSLDENAVSLSVDLSSIDTLDHDHASLQLQKCEEKIAGGDYEGAITNAKTLIETLLRAIEIKFETGDNSYKGDLPKLSKKVHKLLNLQADRQDVSDNLKSVLSGLAKIVNGLAPLRNKMSDAHPSIYKPQRHHAQFVVNASKTYVHFIIDTYEYQLGRGLISPVE